MAYKHTNPIWNNHPDLLIMTSEIFFLVTEVTQDNRVDCEIMACAF